MRIYLHQTLFIAVAIWLVATSGLSAQAAKEPNAPFAPPSRLEVAVTYSATRSDVVGGSSFWMQGGAVQAHSQFYRGWGVVADVAGLHEGNIQSSGVGVDVVTATFGPRYTWHASHARSAFYGQALLGIANGFHSDFPTSSGTVSSSQSLAFKLGGGFNIDLTPHIGLRAIEANWLRTQFPNSSTNVQDSSQFDTGFVLRF